VTAKDKPIQRFTVDLGSVEEMRDDIKSKMDQLGEQISGLVHKVVIDDVPILMPIFSITKERRDLEKLARALNRVAPLMEEMEKLNRRKHLLDIAVEEPGWMAATLGDFSEIFNTSDEFSWGYGGVDGGVKDEKEEGQ
jgi:hypothetical protein